jgi:excisionase family DNA binding protein
MRHFAAKGSQPPGQEQNRPMLLTAQQVAAQLQLSEWSVYEAARNQRLRSIRIGRRVRFKPEDVAAFVESCESVAAEPAAIDWSKLR